MGEMAASENETSDSSRDNFSTSKLVDTFDSNLRELCAVLPPLSYDLLRCDLHDATNHEQILFPARTT